MSETKKTKKEELTFEEAMAKLERISEALAKEGIALEESMKLYSEGVELVRFCSEQLEKAERKIKLLECNQDGELTETDFFADSM